VATPFARLRPYLIQPQNCNRRSDSDQWRPYYNSVRNV